MLSYPVEHIAELDNSKEQPLKHIMLWKVPQIAIVRSSRPLYSCNFRDIKIFNRLGRLHDSMPSQSQDCRCECTLLSQFSDHPHEKRLCTSGPLFVLNSQPIASFVLLDHLDPEPVLKPIVAFKGPCFSELDPFAPFQRDTTFLKLLSAAVPELFGCPRPVPLCGASHWHHLPLY